MKNTLSYEVGVKTHFSSISIQFQLHFGTLFAPNSFKNRIKNRYVNDDAFSSLLERLRAPPKPKKRDFRNPPAPSSRSGATVPSPPGPPSP